MSAKDWGDMWGVGGSVKPFTPMTEEEGLAIQARNQTRMVADGFSRVLLRLGYEAGYDVYIYIMEDMANQTLIWRDDMIRAGKRLGLTIDEIQDILDGPLFPSEYEEAIYREEWE